ncbi:MAG: hypothetical protein OXD47_02965 [Gammaproteobacteria bacterium]|nr:hypothetical protein [Gammaproteobacteria bacterium]MCY4210080.1 hypothetical protein [Gammaproteobacteria bacterium]MCY4337741.1 hypothetical protein [Gammaproteobacteria bacterium]
MDKQTIHLITLIVAIVGSNAWSHANLSGRIGAVEDRLSVRISEVESKLSDRINEVENKLSERINEVEKRLSDRIAALDVRITALETSVVKIDKRLVIVEASLKANNQYIANVLDQQSQYPDALGAQ